MKTPDLSILRQVISRLEGRGSSQCCNMVSATKDDADTTCFTLGLSDADHVTGPMALAALHEIHAAPAAFTTSCNFTFALFMHMTFAAEACHINNRPLIWLEDEALESEYGGLYPHGLSALGFPDRRLVLIRCSKVTDALNAASDALHIKGAGSCCSCSVAADACA